MATSFEGWLSSWGNSWGPIAFDPNAMQGSASMVFSAIGTLTAAGLLEENYCYWDARRKVRVRLRSNRKKRENDDAFLLFVI